MASRLVVVSDLHMSADALEDFDEELESHFVEFLGTLSASGDPIELVLAGDTFDFVQAPPWRGRALHAKGADSTPLCFTEEQSKSKLQAIVAAHHRTFAALRGFLAGNPGHSVVVMPGNHDPDFFFAGVQQDFRTAVEEEHEEVGRRVRVHLERAYTPAQYPDVWIEHGHQFDDVNRFVVAGVERWSESAPPIISDATGTPRLYECVGTRFLVRYLNAIDARYPFVDNVKPFGRFLSIFGVSALVPGFGPLRAALAVASILTFMTGRAVSRPSDLLGIEDNDEESGLAERVQAAFDRLTPPARAAFREQLEARGFDSRSRAISLILSDPGDGVRLLAFLAENPDLVDALEPLTDGTLSMDGTAGTLSLARGFRADETGDLKRGAAEVHRRHGKTTIVMGHTHEPVEHRGEFSYFNLGSWTRYYRFASAEKARAWSLLRSRSYAEFPYRLLYFEATSDGARSIRAHCERMTDG